MPNTYLSNNHLPGQSFVPILSGFWTIPLLTLLKMCPRGQRALLTLNLKKNPRYDIFLKKCSGKRVLWKRVQIWKISSKDINLQYIYAMFIVENRDNIWCNLMHLKISVMGLQVRIFKNCSKWTPAYKDYQRWRSLYFE